MLVSKKKYDQLQSKYDNMIGQFEETQTKYDQLFESVKHIVEICQKWNKEEIGNMRAINTIAALFNMGKTKRRI